MNESTKELLPGHSTSVTHMRFSPSRATEQANITKSTNMVNQGTQMLAKSSQVSQPNGQHRLVSVSPPVVNAGQWMRTQPSEVGTKEVGSKEEGRITEWSAANLHRQASNDMQ